MKTKPPTCYLCHEPAADVKPRVDAIIGTREVIVRICPSCVNAVGVCAIAGRVLGWW